MISITSYNYKRKAFFFFVIGTFRLYSLNGPYSSVNYSHCAVHSIIFKNVTKKSFYFFETANSMISRSYENNFQFSLLTKCHAFLRTWKEQEQLNNVFRFQCIFLLQKLYCSGPGFNSYQIFCYSCFVLFCFISPVLIYLINWKFVPFDHLYPVPPHPTSCLW